jgi:hypothetical protein
MSTAGTHSPNLAAPPIVKAIQRRVLLVGIAAALIALIGGFFQPTVFFRGYLASYMDWLGVALGSMVILMLRHLTGGGWGMVIRRILGAAMRTLPLMAILFVPLLFALPRLYPWARPEEVAQSHHLQELSQTYLSRSGFIVRAFLYLAIWNLLSFLLSKWSREQDQPPLRDNSPRFKALSGPGIILYAFTVSFAAVDWVMSLDPTWISSIYGLIILAGQLLSAICFAVIVERILVDYEPMKDLLQPSFVHDHGKFMLTFVMLWAYFSFSQWLIIWAGNLPEEITWYVRRLQGGWQFVALFLILFHFVIPFVLLLSRPFKRDVRRLVWLAVWLLCTRYVDLLWHIEPNFASVPIPTWADLVLPFAIGGLWLAYFFHNLGSIPLLPAYDVYAKEVLEPAHE